MAKSATPKRRYDKPALTPDEHVHLMKERGLSINDDERAKHYLRFISYYRLSGYALSFQKDHNADGTHTFKDNSNFDQILSLYIFDRKLRLIIMDALERIEIAFRTCLSDELAITLGPHWFLERGNFTEKFDHQLFLDEINRAMQYNSNNNHSPSIFITHYYKKYNDPKYPPCWMVFELLSFGTLSKIFYRLKAKNKKLVSEPFGMHPTVFQSWMHLLSYVRNLCAHHQRVWNRVFTLTPKVMENYETYLTPNDRLYAQLVVMQILLKRIAHDTTWHRKINDLMNGYSFVDSRLMGFPESWRKQPLWGISKIPQEFKHLPAC
jgi:abortive infection bacteriophage resistance protein